jgi:AcrR family transcriptional regulator
MYVKEVSVTRASRPPRRTQAERRTATITELVETARKLFGQDGYAATSINDIAHESGMTKGAVYHHFEGKTELFKAVFVHQEQQLVELIGAATAGIPDPRQRIRRGTHAFLNACTEPEMRRIVLLDGPAALGWETVRQIEHEHTLKLIHNVLADAAGQGLIRSGDITVRAHLLFGALCEIATLAARADDPPTALSAVLKEADILLDALLGSPDRAAGRA